MGGEKRVGSFKMSFKYAENHYSSPQATQVATLVFYTTQRGLGGRRNKDFLFGASPSSVSQSLHSSHIAHMCLDGKGSISQESFLHRPEAPSVLALKDIVGEACILVPPWREAEEVTC